jgi:alkanesulfonate monooxygenase SsuD/methylene tetrahydromethanopterin reductase-like flavin-dependent oxidoreductase (luciferase family)
MLRKKMMLSKRHGVFKSDQAQDDSEITDDYLVDRLVICGSVNKVVDDILQLRDRVGDFGELVYANMDWVDPALAKRSMELMATQVMPRVDQALGTSREKCAAGR